MNDKENASQKKENAPIGDIKSKPASGLSEDRLERLRESARELPYQPGVYIMHNSDGKIIYIGKSKSLHNRVCSYFFSSHHNTKTARMVSQVWYFEYILTDTEIEALALENRLIKLHTPRYNIRLKDCKSYPYIKVDLGLSYPTVTVTRSRIGDRAKYFGPYSGTDVIRDYGREQVETGALIVYTSADSVFQIAAHEDVVPPEQLYEYCRIARKLLMGEHGVGRVIARPFTGEWPYTRTPRRHDFSIEPPKKTVLDVIVEAGKDMIAVGKIHDIFAGRGMTEFTYTTGNADGLSKTLSYADKDFTGLCFVNLVDFDMLYGHRRNIDGYAQALHEFDQWLPDFLSKLGQDDLVIVTADHGCDPGYLKHTDHTREYIPMIALGKAVKPVNLGTRVGFCDIAATVAELLDVPYETPGRSFAKEIV